MRPSLIPAGPRPVKVSQLRRIRRPGPFQCVWCSRQLVDAWEHPFAYLYILQGAKRNVTLPGMFCSDGCCASYHNLEP